MIDVSLSWMHCRLMTRVHDAEARQRYHDEAVAAGCPQMTSIDLRYDARAVDADLVVETCISHGPRRSDASFDPQPGDWVLGGDDKEPPVRAWVLHREENGVRVQLDFGLGAIELRSSS